MKPLIGTKIYNTDSNSGLGSELNDVKSCSEDLSHSPADTLQFFGIKNKKKTSWPQRMSVTMKQPNLVFNHEQQPAASQDNS